MTDHVIDVHEPPRMECLLQQTIALFCNWNKSKTDHVRNNDSIHVCVPAIGTNGATTACAHVLRLILIAYSPQHCGHTRPRKRTASWPEHLLPVQQQPSQPPQRATPAIARARVDPRCRVFRTGKQAECLPPPSAFRTRCVKAKAAHAHARSRLPLDSVDYGSSVGVALSSGQHKNGSRCTIE